MHSECRDETVYLSGEVTVSTVTAGVAALAKLYEVGGWITS